METKTLFLHRLDACFSILITHLEHKPGGSSETWDHQAETMFPKKEKGNRSTSEEHLKSVASQTSEKSRGDDKT